MVEAARCSATWASASNQGGHITTCRKDIESISSIVRATVARPIIPTRSDRLVRTSHTRRSRQTPAGPRAGHTTQSPRPAIAAGTRRAAVGPNHQWPGTGDIGDPLLDQDLAGQNAAIGDNVFAHKLWASRGAELLDKIGPAIIQVHSAGGPFGWIVANERPN